jgi:hypothetical protein
MALMHKESRAGHHQSGENPAFNAHKNRLNNRPPQAGGPPQRQAFFHCGPMGPGDVFEGGHGEGAVYLSNLPFRRSKRLPKRLSRAPLLSQQNGCSSTAANAIEGMGVGIAGTPHGLIDLDGTAWLAQSRCTVPKNAVSP